MPRLALTALVLLGLGATPACAGSRAHVPRPLALYFSVAVWASLAMVRFPRASGPG